MNLSNVRASNPESWDPWNPRSAVGYTKNNERRRMRKSQMLDTKIQFFLLGAAFFFIGCVGVWGYLAW